MAERHWEPGVNRFLTIASGFVAIVVVLAVAHFYLPKPISAARGQWQIKDWYFHPDATREQLEHFRDVRKQYPQTIKIASLGRGSIDSDDNCSWTESLSQQLGLATLPTVWVTSLKCESRDPIELIVRPFASARTPLGVFNYYLRSNDTEITVTFRNANGNALIDYVPAHWPRPSIDALLDEQNQPTVIHVYRDHFEIGERTFTSIDELRSAVQGFDVSYSVRDCSGAERVREVLVMVSERAQDGLATINAENSTLPCEEGRQ
jgi:hypothetical protein